MYNVRDLFGVGLSNYKKNLQIDLREDSLIQFIAPSSCLITYLINYGKFSYVNTLTLHFTCGLEKVQKTQQMELDINERGNDGDSKIGPPT